MPRGSPRQCIIHPYIIEIIDTAPPPPYNRAAFPPLALPAVAVPWQSRHYTPLRPWLWKEFADDARPSLSRLCPSIPHRSYSRHRFSREAPALEETSSRCSSCCSCDGCSL